MSAVSRPPTKGAADPRRDPRPRRRPRLGRGPGGADDRPPRRRAADEQERPLRPLRLQAGAAAGDGRRRRRALPRRGDRAGDERRPTAPRACGRWGSATSITSTSTPAAASGAPPRPSTTTGPAPSATRSPPPSTPGWRSWSARRRSPASRSRERFAFELYAVVMGANARYRLSGDRKVFDYARGALAAARSGAAG